MSTCRGSDFASEKTCATHSIDIVDVAAVLHIHVIDVKLNLAHGRQDAIQIDDTSRHAHVNWFAQFQQVRGQLVEELRQKATVGRLQQVVQIVADLGELLHQRDGTFDANDARQKAIGSVGVL